VSLRAAQDSIAVDTDLNATVGRRAALDQEQEPERARGAARGRGRLGSVTVDAATGICKPKGASRLRRGGALASHSDGRIAFRLCGPRRNNCLQSNSSAQNAKGRHCSPDHGLIDDSERQRARLNSSGRRSHLRGQVLYRLDRRVGSSQRREPTVSGGCKDATTAEDRPGSVSCSLPIRSCRCP
jgi:hypothetical protein